MTTDLLDELYGTLDRRVRPEDLLEPIGRLLGDTLTPEERLRLFAARAVSKVVHPFGWSSMSDDFRRPDGLARQLRVATALFATPTPASEAAADVEVIGAYLPRAEAEIGKRVGESDFMGDRLNREARRAAGVELGRRAYNKRFRLAVRLERKHRKLARELEKRALTLASKSRLASELPRAEFVRDVNSAAFVAYLTARCHVRSTFTNTRQTRPYDEIAELLMRRCRASESTNWWAVAHVHPDPEVLAHLTPTQHGELLGRFYEVLERAARLMQEVWTLGAFDRETMIVRRGNDSSTWNLLAGAWNAARDGWVNALYALDADEVLNVICPGKAMRLMAADVASWHRASGGDLDANTVVWSRLPLPWEVLLGEAPCTCETVADVCADVGLDPHRSGWISPRPRARAAPFRPTPELVHGVSVWSPGLARALRRAGVFSGKTSGRTVD